MNNYNYVGFYNGQRVEVYATDVHGARNQVIFHFRVPKSKQGLVAVLSKTSPMLAERPDGGAEPGTGKSNTIKGIQATPYIDLETV